MNSYGAGLIGNGCVGDSFSPGTFDARHRPLLESPDRLAGLAVERVQNRLLRRLEHAGDAPSADVHVHDDRRGRRVVVPDVVVHHLVVPQPLAGLDVERDEARRKQVVARAEAAVHVLRGAVGRDVDDAALRIGRQRRPRRHVAGRPPRVVLPRVVADFARPRDHVELPHELPGAARRRPGCRRARSPGASGDSPARRSCRRSITSLTTIGGDELVM